VPSQVITSTENNFTKGLITEATGLNFPENAATSASNCEFTLVGDVVRRDGINIETNGVSTAVSISNIGAVSSYVWNNPGGQSDQSILVEQLGGNLYFYSISNSTTASPLSEQAITSIALSNFAAYNASFDITLECQFASGNGYLFVYQGSCQPFYCTYANGIIAGTIITTQIRDFIGVTDNPNVNIRPNALTDPHFYNLQNQGWTIGNPWTSTSGTSYTLGTLGNSTFTISTGLTISSGTTVTVYYEGSNTFGITTGQGASSGTVVSYTSSTGALVINVTTILTLGFSETLNNWLIVPSSTGNINTFQSAAAVYPSNADVWWYFKDNTGAFNPATTLNNVTLATGRAPQGHFILDAFIMQRSQYVSSINIVSTTKRPTTGAWWQGRVWYSGVDDAVNSTSNTAFYSWTGNIYFSTVVQSPADFGICYQTNDPTSENLNGIIPTDGGIISIPEAGSIHKLFPIQNGMLVFADNGIWFITGSQGIGFAANDYTITKISSVRALSGTSFVDVMGLPYFWNEEGIYSVNPSNNNSLTTDPITLGTILTFYKDIPIQSKKYCHAAYDPINYVIKWVYRSTQESGTGDRYYFDSILNYNVYNKAFYPYSIAPINSNGPYINSIAYVSYPVITVNTPEPSFKYPSIQTTSGFSKLFAEENDSTYTDWKFFGGVDVISTFTTGFKLHGKGLTKFQIPYINTFNRTNGSYAAFYIQGLWDYYSNSNGNRWSAKQFVEILDNNTSMVVRKHRLRGRGLVLQLKFTSVSGQPFDIMGWAIYENVNTGV